MAMMNPPTNNINNNQIQSTNTIKHFFENLLSIVLILITVSSLSYAASNLLCQHKAKTAHASTLIPAIYEHQIEPAKISL